MSGDRTLPGMETPAVLSALAMALIALQFGVLAYLFSLLAYEETRGQVRPARTPLPSYLTALTAVAATTLAGVSLFMTGLDVLAKWAGQKLDLVQGLLALVFLGLASLAAIALTGVWVARSVVARLRLQPGEMAVLVLEAVLLVAVSFIVLLAW